MKIKIATLVLVFSLLHIQCKKDNKAEVDVSQITHTDELGNSTGSSDSSDWKKDNTWTNNEIQLFEAPASSQLAGTETSTISSGLAFPNPMNSVFTLYFKSSGTALMELVITDRFLGIRYRHYVLVNAGANLMQANLDPAQFANHTNYRVYYGFYSLADGQFYKGHGDISISR